MPSPSPYITATAVASSIPFDNSTNGFASSDVQSAIEESKSSLSYYSVTGISILTRTSAVFTTVSGMSITPASGTYLVLWSAQTRLGTVSGQGEVAIFVDTNQQTALTHQSELDVTIVLGLLGVANATEGGSNIVGIISANGSQAVTAQYRSVDGQTMTISNRSLVLIKVG